MPYGHNAIIYHLYASDILYILLGGDAKSDRSCPWEYVPYSLHYAKKTEWELTQVRPRKSKLLKYFILRQNRHPTTACSMTVENNKLTQHRATPETVLMTVLVGASCVIPSPMHASILGWSIRSIKREDHLSSPTVDFVQVLYCLVLSCIGKKRVKRLVQSFVTNARAKG